MIKIAHFIYDSSHNPWLGGGGYIRTVEIYKRFPENYKIDLFCGDFYNSSEISPGENIRVRFIGKKCKKYALSRFWYIIKAVGVLSSKSKKYDLVVEDFSPYSPVFSFIYVKKNKLICILQNWFGLRTHFKKFGPAGFVPFLFEKFLLKRYKNFIFSSQDLKEIVYKKSNISPVNSVSIPNGISDTLLKSQKSVAGKGLLFAGRLEIYQKGIDFLLEQFSLLLDNFGDLTLSIAGSGKDYSKINLIIDKLNIREKIILKGKVDVMELRDLYSSSYITVIPSRYESWGMVSLESQACGTPVIASNIPGLRQTLQHEKTGFLFNTADQFRSFVSLLLNDKKLHKKMSEESRRFASEFTWDKQACRTKEFFESDILMIR